MSHKSAEAEARYKEKVLFHYRREWNKLMESWPTQEVSRAFVVRACAPLTHRTDLRVLCGTGFQT